MPKNTSITVCGLALLAAVYAFTGAVPDSAPAFTLDSVGNKAISLEDYKGKYVVLEWWNYGCPVVQKHYRSGNIPALQKEFTEKGAVWLTICSSGPGKQGYITGANGQDQMAKMGGKPSETLMDPTGATGRAYRAKASPQLVLISPKGEILYNGAIDDNPGAYGAEILKSKNYLRQAWDEVHAGKAVSVPNTPAYGCNIKYAN